MTDRSRTGRTRREVLAFAGVSLATLSGCNGIENPLAPDPEPATIPGSSLSAALDAAIPTFAEPLPVDVQDEAAEERRSRVRDLLSSVPSRFDASNVPNGAIRAALSETRGEATTALEEAESAGSDVKTLSRLRDARRDARQVAAGWAAIEDELTLADVESEADPIRDEVRAFRERWRYVGDPGDPVAALLVHAVVEDHVETATRALERSGDPRDLRSVESPVAVGELAATVESARASLADARYLSDRFEASIERSTALGPTFRAVDESLAADLDERVGSLPTDEDATVTEGDARDAPIGEAVSDLRRGLGYRSAEHDRETGQRATVVLSLADDLRRARALESLLERIENGEYVVVTSGEDVRSLRDRAITAAETAAETERRPRLSRALGSLLPRSIELADEEIARYADDETVEVQWLTHPLSRYVTSAAMGLATPPVAEDVASALDAASA